MGVSVCVWGGIYALSGGVAVNNSNNQIQYVVFQSQMMLYAACMAYLKDKLIGSKPKKDSAALCNCVAIFTNKTQNIIKHEGLYMTKTNCISVMNLLWDRAKIKSCYWERCWTFWTEQLTPLDLVNMSRPHKYAIVIAYSWSVNYIMNFCLMNNYKFIFSEDYSSIIYFIAKKLVGSE